MIHDHINRVDIENYGCIRSVSVNLSPIHALIGPNDSGKSTILRALRTATQLAVGNFGPDPSISPSPFNPMIDVRTDGLRIGARYNDDLMYVIETRGGIKESVWRSELVLLTDERPRSWQAAGLLQKPSEVSAVQVLVERLSKATMVRLDTNALRRPARQLLAPEPIQFFDETGGGLASIYQAINSRDVDGFVALRDKVRQLFPTVKTIRVPTIENNSVSLQIQLMDGTIVPAEAMSEGLLYFLAFSALEYLDETKLLLVEEPENGLHPARIAQVMTILREISKRTQVVIATHSPLVVNELAGNEVTVVTRDPEQGTRAKLLCDTKNYAERSELYRNGELWVAYGDGDTEKALIEGGPRP